MRYFTKLTLRSALLLTSLFLISQTQPIAQAQNCPTYVYELNRHATVFLNVVGSDETNKQITSQGTGFIVSESGYVLTALHVIRPTPKFTVASMTAQVFSRNG